MALTELTTGLRCIEHAAPEIAPGVVPGCWDHSSGKTPPFEAMFVLGRSRLLLMRNSEHLIQAGEVHMRVIARRSRFWASRAWASTSTSGEGASARIRAQRRSHDPPVRVGEMRTHDSH